jgi:hypothetical protein
VTSILKTCFAAAAMFGAVWNCSAITFTDLDVVNTKLSASGTATYASTFNIKDDGFVPGYHKVDAAIISFWLADDGDSAGEAFKISLDGFSSSSQTMQSQNAFTTYLLLGTTQVGIGLLASLNVDGVLDYRVTATYGDFWLKSAILIADAEIAPTSPGPGTSGGSSVPDTGSTLILSSIGLAFILAGRRMAANRRAA